MESSIWKQAARFLQDQKNHKKRLGAFVCLAAVAVLGTTAVLKYNGIAMTHKQKVLECPYEVHTHTQLCYSTVEGERVLTCGLADYVVHTHNDDCYSAGGKLVCPLPEIEEHKHDERCYTTQQVLVCSQAESVGHVHGDGCYTTEQGELTCQTEAHQHGDGCYDESGVLTCTQAEHQHTDACYSVSQVLTCTQAEGDGGHTHSDGCYESTKVLSCGKLELHTHDPKNCYDSQGRLTCEETVLEQHVHSDSCFKTVELTPEEVAALNQPVFLETEESAAEETESPEASGVEEIGSALEAGSSVEEDAVELPPLRKVFENDTVKVTAYYYEEAEIPEDAELEVTCISDEDRIAACTAAAAAWMEPEDAVWLFDMGISLNGNAVAPKDTVYVTMQVFHEAFAAGMPVSVVRFAENEMELLETSAAKLAEDGGFCTAFDVENFSEFLVILGKAPEGADSSGTETETETEKIEYSLNDTFSYETDELLLTLHVDGIATTEVARTEEPAVEEPEASDQEVEPETAPEADGATGTETEQDTDINAETDADAEKTIFTLEIESGEEEDSGEPEQDEELPVLTAEDVEFTVEQLGEDQDAYIAFMQAVKQEAVGEDAETDAVDQAEENAKRLLAVLRLGFGLDGAELDISDCTVTAEVTPKAVVFTEADADADTEPASSITLTAMQYREDEAEADVETLECATVSEAEIVPLSFFVESNIVALSAEKPVINYSVQYYAKLDMPKKVAKSDMEIIDTSAEANGGVPVLPSNGTTPQVRRYSVDDAGQIITEEVLEKIYNSGEETYDFNVRYDLDLIKLLPGTEENDDESEIHYELAEIWVLKEGRDPESEEKADWNTYTDTNAFTNEFLTADENAAEGKILIKDGTVLRLVYEPKTGAKSFGATFYDYDITKDGADENNKVETTAYGINSNCGDATPMLAFGNNNAGTKFGTAEWNGQTPNKANPNGFKNCTFGIVGQSLSGGLPAFQLAAPKIFGAETQNGKMPVNGYTLNFNRVGDTYTLESVSNADGGVAASGLSTFWSRLNWNKTLTMYCNNFWPMDGVEGLDPKFGAVAGKDSSGNEITKYQTENASGIRLPVSDNKQEHNNYFGMQYAVSFTLTENYAGPLEYMFFGDDDMWVYLDGQLVADIGGVHSAVGTYVDLWDYLEEGVAGKHTLSVFYTERGASGSTCYMQFTLPSVMQIAPVDLTAGGNLKLTKEVLGEADADTRYAFSMELENAGASYPYTITHADGTQDAGNIQGSNDFQLLAGDELLITGLPLGTKYTITEVEQPGFIATATVDGKAVSLTDGAVSGTIVPGSTVTVAYTNHTSLELPETGGVGTTTLYTLSGIVLLAVLLMYGSGSQRRRRRRESTQT